MAENKDLRKNCLLTYMVDLLENGWKSKSRFEIRFLTKKQNIFFNQERERERQAFVSILSVANAAVLTFLSNRNDVFCAEIVCRDRFSDFACTIYFSFYGAVSEGPVTL